MQSKTEIKLLPWFKISLAPYDRHSMNYAAIKSFINTLIQGGNNMGK